MKIKRSCLVILFILSIVLIAACTKKNKNEIHIPYFSSKPTYTLDNAVYSYVQFGHYPQTKVEDDDLAKTAAYDDNDEAKVGGKKIKRMKADDGNEYWYYYIEPIVWRVIWIDGEEAILISEKLIEFKEFHDEDINVQWGKSSLRSYLNESFMNDAFDDRERQSIIKSNVKNYHVNYGYPLKSNEQNAILEETQDYVYLPSRFDFETLYFDCPYKLVGTDDKYNFPNANNALKAELTDYVKDKAYHYSGSKYKDIEVYADCPWWSRTTFSDYVVVVLPDGEDIDNELNLDDPNWEYSNRVDCKNGVRPVIKVKLKALKVVENK